ncbi:hypothetical protein M2284_000326 [Rhodococcus sp. LBL1]|nr:hypothetical protein [Rhodococcus sp. LBL1]MDH6681424.1 hypothetical protein [Rhodococcus sp. LBL2]
MGSLAAVIQIPVMTIDALGVGILQSFRNLVDYTTRAFS